jgi:hypothetical protein
MGVRQRVAESEQPHRHTNQRAVESKKGWLGTLTGVLAVLAPVFGITSLPQALQVVKSYHINIPFSKVPDAEEQNQRWTNPKNLECLQHAQWMTVRTERNDSITVTACQTGDILVKVQPPASQAYVARWIAVGDLKPGQLPPAQSSAWSESVAFAGDDLAGMQLAQGPATGVVCQKMEGGGILLQRVRFANGTCADQRINTYSGLLVSSTPVACTPKC